MVDDYREPIPVDSPEFTEPDPSYDKAKIDLYYADRLDKPFL